MQVIFSWAIPYEERVKARGAAKRMLADSATFNDDNRPSKKVIMGLDRMDATPTKT